MDNFALRHKRLNVLMSAHEISPELGSECSSGWNIITRLASFHDITLLYAETNQFQTQNYRQQVEHYESFKKVPGIKFIPIPQPYITRVIAAVNQKLSNNKSSVGLSFLYFLGVKFWEKSVLKKAIELKALDHYDIIHHFNHISFREPGYLWKLDIPFIWGPTSGFSQVPMQFLKGMPFNEKIINIVRNYSNTFQLLLSRRIRKAIRKSRLIYYVTKDDGVSFGKLTQFTKNMLDMGTYPSDKQIIKNFDITKKVTVLWVGRISHLKALYILLNAIARSEILKSQICVKIIGDGPQFDYCKNRAEFLELNNISWLGNIGKKEVYQIMLESQILVHTSIKEAASAVILESLSAGLPVICHDAFGMSFSICKDSGIKVPFVSPEISIEGFRLALEFFVKNPIKINEFKINALRRAEELTWDKIALSLSEDYHNVIDKH